MKVIYGILGVLEIVNAIIGAMVVSSLICLVICDGPKKTLSICRKAWNYGRYIV